MTYDRGDYRDKWRIERRANAVRSRLGLDQLDVMDPRLLARDLDAKIFKLEDLVDGGAKLVRARQIPFDGAALFDPATGRALIVLNCGRPRRRRTATLMEELAHLELGHKPTRIERDPRLGLWRRTFDVLQEREAYDLGSALLLPKERVQRDVKERRQLARDIADEHGCSEELVVYRVRRMRLWDRYRSYAEAVRP